MVDLGPYAGAVLGGYGAALGLLAALVALTLWRGRRVARALQAQEDRLGGKDG